MPTSQTQKEVTQTLRGTKCLVWCYKKRAEKYWRRHKGIRIVLFLEVISEFGLLLVGQNCDSCGDSGSYWVYGFEIGILVTLGLTILWDFFSNYARKAEIFDIANMEYRVVKVELKALLDEIKNCKDDDDEVLRRKHGELTRKVTEVTKWAEITKFRLRHPRTIKSDPETW